MTHRKAIRVVTALIEQQGSYLLTQRKPHAVFPLRWEFPGGKVEPDETDRVALARELKERLGASVEVGELYSETCRDYERLSVELRVYRCTLLDSVLLPLGVHAFRFVPFADLANYPFPPADEASVSKLLSEGLAVTDGI